MKFEFNNGPQGIAPQIDDKKLKETMATVAQDVTFDEARLTPVFQNAFAFFTDIDSPKTIFAWHGDTFTSPPFILPTELFVDVTDMAPADNDQIVFVSSLVVEFFTVNFTNSPTGVRVFNSTDFDIHIGSVIIPPEEGADI